MPESRRRSIAPATLALILTLFPFLTASAMMALSLGARLDGLLLTFVELTGPFMFILFIVGSATLLYAVTRTERKGDWRLILSGLLLAGALVNFTLYLR